MKYVLILLVLSTSLLSCENLIGTSPTTSGDATVVEPQVVKPVDPFTIAKLTSMAMNSSCAKTTHVGQGVPTQNYMKGIALTYARVVCRPNSDSYKIASQPLGGAHIDALTHYGLKPQTPEERLNMTFSLMIGSGARESTWRWCVGKDANASNTEASSCEAGLYQTSYNARYNYAKTNADLTLNAARENLYKQFKANKEGCFAAEYKGNVTCSAANLKNWGTGEGVKFQELSKQCPGFATEYHLMTARERRTHYGPINLKKSEVKPVCTDMFEQIRKSILADKEFCKLI